MRTDEAFKILKNAAWLGLDEEREAVEEAVTMACNALATIEQITWERDTAMGRLKELGYGLCDEPKTNDLISRHAVLRTAYSVCRACEGSVTDYRDLLCAAILDLPSAQPNLRPTCDQLAIDCINRQAAIDELDKGAWGVEWDKALAKTMIESLPSAQPDPSQCWGCNCPKMNAQPELHWIPCSERLPDKPNVYTVTDHDGRVVRYVYNDNESSREYWKRCAKAWMPLPEPYKEEEKDATD